MTMPLTKYTVLLDPRTYDYWNATFQRNESPPVSFPNEYNTDLVKERALGFLDAAKKSTNPFFVGIAPIGPHAAWTGVGDFLKPDPAPRHKDLFPNVKAPRTSNWNPKDVSFDFLSAEIPYLGCSYSTVA